MKHILNGNNTMTSHLIAGLTRKTSRKNESTFP